MFTSTARRALVALAAAGALTLGACSDAGSDDGVTEIDFYYPINVGGPLESVVNEFIADFESENPDIKVTPVYSGDYNQTIAAVRSATESGDAPAAAVLMSTELYTLHDGDMIIPIHELTDDEEWLNSFDDAFLENSTLDGEVASIPFQRSTVVQFWNKEHFAEAGLDPETPPQTWDELVDMGKQLQEDSGATWAVQIPSDVPNGAWLMQALSIQNGVKLSNDDGTEVYMDDPATVEALEFWAGLADEGISPTGTIAWGTLPNDFASGNTSVIWTTTGQLTNIREQADFDFGVSVLPSNVQPGSPTGGGNIYIMKDAPEEEQQAAVKLAQFLSTPENQAKWTIASGYVAPSPAAWDTDALKEYVADFPQAEVARDQLPVAVGELATYHRGTVEDAINVVIGAVMNGEDAATAAENGQRNIDGILAEYK